MKNIVLFLSLLLSLSSCSSTYFYSTLQTVNDNVEKIENGDFLYENDSLWIAYCFKGEDAPIQITVFNKLDIPLYIDWTKSSLIVSEQTYPYSDGDITYVGGVEEEEYMLLEHISHISPQSMGSYSTLRIAAQFHEIKGKEYARGKLETKNKELVEIRRISYELQNTPLTFGSLLTLYTKPETAYSYKTDFYVSNLIKTKVVPQNLPADMAERGDTFYQRRRPDNTGWYVVADVVTIGAMSAVDVVVFGGEND